MTRNSKVTLITTVALAAVILVLAAACATYFINSPRSPAVLSFIPAPLRELGAELVSYSRAYAAGDAYPKLAPYSAVRWNGDTPQVKANGTWYELDSVDGIRAADILAFLKQSNDFAPQKHFAEDLVEVMSRMGHRPGRSVSLQLKTLDTHQPVTLNDVAMTEENRRAVWSAGVPGGQPFGGSYATLAPYSALRWDGSTPQVMVSGAWYQLDGINGIAAADIVGYLKKSGDAYWRKHFGEDLVEAMSRMGHRPGYAVSLQLTALDDHRSVTLQNVAMTEDNRQAIWAAGGAGVKP